MFCPEKMSLAVVSTVHRGQHRPPWSAPVRRVENFRPRPIRAAVTVYKVRDDRDAARAIRTRQGDGETSLPATTEGPVLKMNYNDYYARQVGGALFVRYQRGHGLGRLFGSLLRSAMTLVKRSAVALGKGS